jgi:hypothetical protein
LGRMVHKVPDFSKSQNIRKQSMPTTWAAKYIAIREITLF